MNDADLDRLAEGAAQREAEGRADPEPSLGVRLGQIGVLGWTIIVRTLLFLFLGRWLDGIFGTGIFLSAPLLMIGAAMGLWFAWRWSAPPKVEAAMAIGLAGQIAVGLIAGLLIGGCHFASLWWNTRLFAAGAAGKAIALQFGRIALAVDALTLLARLSLVALLCGGGGFLVARPLLVWRFGGTAMIHSPLETPALFHIGPVGITEPAVITWAIMAFLTLFASPLRAGCHCFRRNARPSWISSSSSRASSR